MRFDHVTLAQRVSFAPNGAQGKLAEEIGALGATRVMVIASPRDTETAHRIAADIEVAAWHHEVVMHVPVDVADRARTVAAEHGVDALVCIGGGSATGLAKAVALTTGIPIVAVPTTYAGSEATDVWGLTDNGTKTTGVDARVLPVAVVYDSSLTMSLPVDLSISSGLNALAHCVDALWGPRVDPIDTALASEAMRALRIGLSDVSAGRDQLLYGAYLAAVSFASTGSGLHHKICHVLGGMFDLPHAQTHAVVLPHVLAFNAPNAPDAAARVAAAFDTHDSVTGLVDLYRRLDAPRSLQELGMPRDGIPQATKAVLAVAPPSNPTPVTEQNITALLEAAWKGTDPS
ncbi:maleylacetate reductase [Rhodococcoides trifolii]|uniref:Maleylacetate reductase n=1 Tax=Rhodococcoides trifolii TaxID=908250 RepID=A0A917G219_9NOCA|nr:maleylacetate reductase [Rhodococcus trifolii]GGG18933.1 maleylacetate reductase [Rhodococcus trifolii]